jgi:four helix bundle protein
MKDNPDENIILSLTFKFALGIISLGDLLHKDKKYVLSNQLLKSGTSIGANIKEAQGAESKMDFIHKIKISYKEAEETEYWLLLINHSYRYSEIENLLEELVVIKKILGKIIATSKTRYN